MKLTKDQFAAAFRTVQAAAQALKKQQAGETLTVAELRLLERFGDGAEKKEAFTAEVAAQLLDANLANLRRKVESGKPLTTTELAMLRAASDGRPAAQARVWVRTKVELAEALGCSRRTLANWMKLPEHPKTHPDGRYDVGEWRAFARSRGTLPSGGVAEDALPEMDTVGAALQGQLLTNWRKEFLNRKLQGEHWPKAQIRLVCAQAIQAAKTRSFSGLPRLVTLVRLAKGEEEALKAARAEMISVWRQMETCEWFKPDPA